MRGLVYRKGEVRLETDLPDPPATEGEVVIRVALAGICATDIEISKGYMAYEGVLGHEFVGRVDAPEHPEWNGVRVVGGINCACGLCERCLRGQSNHCADRTVLGILGRSGAFAERTILPLENLVKVPDEIRDEDAVYAEPLAAVLRIREQVEIVPGTRVVILGDGRLGLLAACVGVALGWEVSLVGKHPERMRKAASEAPRFGTGEAQEGAFDIAVDCTGSCDGLEEALRLLKPRGKLVLKTTVADSAPMNLSTAVINEVEIIGSRCGNMSDAVRFLEQSRFRPSILTTATYPLSRGEEAFKATQAPQNIKVLLDVTERG